MSVNLLNNERFANVRREVYTGRKTALASVQASSLTLFTNGELGWSQLGHRSGCSCLHLAHTHSSFLFFPHPQIPSQCHVLGSGRERWLPVLLGLFFPPSFLTESPLKAGEIPRHSSLPASPPFFSVLHRNAESLSHTNLWY